MPKNATYPTLLDNVIKLDISILKKQHQLNFNDKIYKEGKVYWESRGKKTAEIMFRVNTTVEQPYIELSYRSGEKHQNYKVDLVTVPSNLGKGKVWYFRCPHTFKRCRKLYLIGGEFLHREAFKGCMYICQTESKRFRLYNNTIGAIFKARKLYDRLSKKYAKDFYNGKPTKRYLKTMLKIRELEAKVPEKKDWFRYF